ncbi:DUF4397 domain-containing protein [Vibrio gallicus]|uniref:DUF4397 domain-containing protein n=1 Tax=Vibrio gallicus TaxID=190897 RepID=UPI0021C259D2|nr:DUF4397 domain-containing protein [Vibrio gallicus]
MLERYLPAVLATSALILVGCNDDDNDNATQSHVQAVHALSDAPLANVIVNDEPALSGVDYATASGYVSLEDGENSVQVDVQLPAGDVATVVPRTVLDLDPNTLYTIMVVGQADPSSQFAVEPLIITRDSAGDGDVTTVDVQAVHAAPGVPDVDVHVTAPDANIDPATALATLAYKDFTGVVFVPGGEYRIRLALAGSTTVAFDSGSVALPEGAELTVAAIPNTHKITGSSPVKLLVMDGTTSFVVHDVNDQAEIRVGHLSSNTPVVDVSVNGNEAISDLSFTDVTDYVPLDSATYDLGVYAFDNPGVLQIDAADTELAPGVNYSVYAINDLPDIAPLVILDKRRPVATSATLNVLHAASVSAAAEVDIHLTSDGNIINSDPALVNFTYTSFIEDIYVAGGTYFVTVTAPGSKTPILGPTEVTLEDGKVYKAIATNGGLFAADITE